MAKKMVLKRKMTWTFLVLTKSMDLRKQNLQKRFWAYQKIQMKIIAAEKQVSDPLKIKDDEGKLIDILKL